VKAIILVAGIGTRLKPLTDTVPKCLTEVNGKSILFNMLEQLNSVGVEETILVIGYLGNQIKERIGDKFGNMKITYLKNDIYNQTNTSYSLLVGLNDLEIDDNLLVLEGDVFFERSLLINFLNDGFLTSTVVQKYNPNLDGSFVELNGDKVVDWIHKKTRPTDFTIEDKFKTVNIHKFDNLFLKNVLKPVLNRHVEEKKGTEPIEFVMQDIVKEKHGKIHAFETGTLKWFEIDNIAELRIAEEMFKEVVIK
tara:strand:- start:922 stop:1674 length:753 start_codon:yes stop_codon:yes gene_type:complete